MLSNSCRYGIRAVIYLAGKNPRDGNIGIKQISTQIPGTFKLYQNYPNPFNPVTNIKYEVPFRMKVTLKIYDVNGKEVKVLVNGIQNAGSYSVDWNGESYASGVYFYRLEAEGFSKSYKMVLIK